MQQCNSNPNPNPIHGWDMLQVGMQLSGAAGPEAEAEARELAGLQGSEAQVYESEFLEFLQPTMRSCSEVLLL